MDENRRRIMLYAAIIIGLLFAGASIYGGLFGVAGVKNDDGLMVVFVYAAASVLCVLTAYGASGNGEQH